jgi:hypothetical protein
VTAVTLVAAPITGAVPGLMTVESALVLTLQVVVAGVPAEPVVTLPIVRVAAALLASAQLAPASVIVTVVEDAVAVAEQLLKPLPSVIAGVAAIVKIDVVAGNTAVITSPLPSAPVALAVNPTVHADVDAVVCRAPLNATALTLVAALITGAVAGLTAAV